MAHDLLFVKEKLGFFSQTMYPHSSYGIKSFYIVFDYTEQVYIFAHEKSLMLRTVGELWCTEVSPGKLWRSQRVTFLTQTGQR